MIDKISIVVPILILTLFILYPQQTIYGSHTILGKLFVIIVILFYAYIDILYGILACIIVVFYYQTDVVRENMNEFVSDVVDVVADKHEFETQYCKNGHLHMKGTDIKPEISQHIFPQLQFEDDNHKCNICDPTCEYSLKK